MVVGTAGVDSSMSCEQFVLISYSYIINPMWPLNYQQEPNYCTTELVILVILTSE